jgi:hypothetical protein
MTESLDASFGSEEVVQAIIERLEFTLVESPSQQAISQRWVSGENRTVEVGRDNSPRHGTFSGVKAIANPTGHASEGFNGRGQPRTATVVLETAQRRDANERWSGHLFDHFANSAGLRRANGLNVEQAESSCHSTVAGSEAGPNQLESGANRQEHCPIAHRPEEGRVVAEEFCSSNLRTIFTATEAVHIGVWYSIAGDCDDGLNLEVASSRSLGQHHGVAAVSVGAEEVREDRADPQGHGSTRSFTSRNAV